jgi:hypothetical protein
MNEKKPIVGEQPIHPAVKPAVSRKVNASKEVPPLSFWRPKSRQVGEEVITPFAVHAKS